MQQRLSDRAGLAAAALSLKHSLWHRESFGVFLSITFRRVPSGSPHSWNAGQIIGPYGPSEIFHFMQHVKLNSTLVIFTASNGG